MNSLSNNELAVIFDHLVSGNVPGGLHAWANLLCASKSAWEVEQQHRYRSVCFEAYDVCPPVEEGRPVFELDLRTTALHVYLHLALFPVFLVAVPACRSRFQVCPATT